MKSAVILAVLVVGAGMLLAKGLDVAAPGSGEPAMPEIEPLSVAHHCTKAIPLVWQYARESGQDVDGVKGKLAYVAFGHVATRYCICNQERFGENRSDGEKALFGKLAGLNLTMHFSHHFTKSRRKKLNEEAQSIVNRHRSLIERKPAWLKGVNNDFRTCRNEQKLTTRFSSYGSR